MKKLIFFIIPFLIVACNQKKMEQNIPIKPTASGKSGEIIVVIPDDIWKSNVGDSIFYKLSSPFKILPQDEPIFNVIHIDPSSFQSIFKTHRNIIFIDIKHDNPLKVTTERNKWANMQLIYKFLAPDTLSFYELWRKYADKIMDSYFNEEISRYQKAFKKSLNEEAIAKIAEKYHIYLALPSSFKIDVQKDHFAWISRETQISSQGIFIYDYPYTDKNTFSTDFLVKKRDEITKLNVPGPKKNTYMQTEKRVPVYSEEISINGQYAILLRGLWYTENYFLGGPFISITTLDKKRNRIVTVDAYVYAGKQKKKLYLWQCEAILKTLKILE